MDRFDYVIVGAGSAGCVLTNRLSEDPDTSVCVLEAGPSDWHPYIHLPAGFIKTFHMKSINWAYQQEPGPYTGGRSIYAPRGKTLGGSSSINGHIYNRGQRQDFDTWAQMGNRGWGYAGRAAVLQAAGEAGRRGRGHFSRARRQSHRHHHGVARSALRSLHGRRGLARHSPQPRLQRREAGRRLLLPAHHRQGPARLRARPRSCIPR